MTAGSRDGRSAALSDFQRATARHAFRRLYVDGDSSRRFLVADETGLGKTHVAKEVIALTLDHLQQVDHVDRIDVVYVCSNADIARQNIRKLTIAGSESRPSATRLSLLITQPDVLKPAAGLGGKPATFVAFTPATSFQFGLQMGTARERAVLYVLLRAHLGLRRARATAAARIFQGGVTSRRRFLGAHVGPLRGASFETEIQRTFLAEFDRSPERAALLSLVEEVAGRRRLSDAQAREARRVVGALRRMLARAAVRALEPDLVILDEFQRFRDLLSVERGGEAAELAGDLFDQPDAHVLLLSATPYKPFTYAEEASGGSGHYEDFLQTLEFLAKSDEPIAAVRSELDALREAALSGAPAGDIRDRVQAQLRRWIARTERPQEARRTTTLDMTAHPFRLQADDFAGWVALTRVASEVRAPLGVEYWKSSPYFLNFLSGYRVGERLRERMKDPDVRGGLMPLFRGAQRIARSDVEGFRPLDWANPRMRALAAEMLEPGWWRLLWMPPSLPYHALGGPYATVDPTAITKQLIFSSWVAAPSAIASLLSYEVQRRIFTGAREVARENTPAARAAISSRLDYRAVDERPASMAVLALFWPQPELASRTDPLEAARQGTDVVSVEHVLEWARGRVEALIGPAGTTSATASAAWHWFAPVTAERGSALASALLAAPRRTQAEALTGVSPDHTPEVPRALDAHTEQVLRALGGWAPESERPADLVATTALLGVGAPGNIAWRALNRLRRADDRVTDLGRWRAAAIIASGLRSLFARPDAMLLVDGVYGGSGSGHEDDGAYWRRVARYCMDGGLQSVLDEYVHHLAGESGADTTTDEGLIALAATARRAIALRESVYRATDIDNFDGEGIAFPSRYALRFGRAGHEQDEARLPEIRAAFNSPFWPFVLATTSVGQEGIDFHWWCHSIVHWNLPGNPVDFEQREGRVDRYKGHAIRKNVAAAHRRAALATGVRDPWSAVFNAAAADDAGGLGDLSPCWIYPGDARLQRRIMALPLSRDEERWARLQESLALYRLAFGQPRQEDMLAALERRGIAERPERIAELRIDLRPPTPRTEREERR